MIPLFMILVAFTGRILYVFDIIHKGVSLIKPTGQTAQLTDQFSLTHQFYDCFVYDTSRRYW